MKHLYFVLVLALAASQTFANNDRSFSFDVIYGSNEQEFDFEGEDLANVSESSSTLGIRFTWWIFDDIGIDTTYSDFDDAEGTENSIDFSISTQSLSLGLVGFIPLWNDSVLLLGRAGFSYWEFDSSFAVTTTTNTISFGTQEEDISIYGALAVQYLLSKSIYLGVEYLSLETQVDALGDNDITSFNAIIGFNF